MRKQIFGLLAAVLLSACGEQAAAPQKTTAASAPAPSAASASAKVYRVATDAEYPPFQFRDERGNIFGMDIDLMDAIAADQGFKVSYYHHTWTGIFSQLEQKKADMVVSALIDDEESRRYAALSKTYYVSPDRVVVVKPEYLKDGKWKTLKVAIAENDYMLDKMKNVHQVAEQNIRISNSLYRNLQDLLKGEIDAVVGDTTVLQYYMSAPQLKESASRFVYEDLPTEPLKDYELVFAVRKDDPELLAKVNQGLDNLKQNGTYDKILAKWRQGGKL